MKRLIFCLAAILLLAGCANEAVQQEDAVESQVVITPKATATAEPVQDEAPEIGQKYLMDEALKNQILGELKASTATVMPINYQQVSYGDHFVFGIGLQNIGREDDEYLIKAYFTKAYDKYTNTIAVDEEMMNSWIKTTFSSMILAPGQKEVLSLVIEVGDISEGKKAPSGTYVFDIETLQKEGNSVFTGEVTARRKVTVKVP